jgi:hypothetical protein
VAVSASWPFPLSEFAVVLSDFFAERGFHHHLYLTIIHLLVAGQLKVAKSLGQSLEPRVLRCCMVRLQVFDFSCGIYLGKLLVY